MGIEDTIELSWVLDELEARLSEGDVDIDAFVHQYPDFAEELREHFMLLCLTSLPRTAHEDPDAPEAALAAWQAEDWRRFVQMTQPESLPDTGVWTRLRRSVPQVLEDLAGFSVMRGGHPVYQRRAPVMRPSAKSAVRFALHDPGLVDLKPLRRGDRLQIVCTLPRAGALMILHLIRSTISVLHPTTRKQVRMLLPGAREDLSLEVSGTADEEQVLAFLMLPETLAATLVGAMADTLISSLAGRSDVVMRGYRFRVAG